ncbi:tumor necrosis factor receptor superfamily member 9-like [Heterodontus francisci]|uniref:tumor necrosis factor receptor superfamily member 9-like n=1 Tax=Heterodontus francisci TaxID=7792 RepID=UPI00355AFA6B
MELALLLFVLILWVNINMSSGSDCPAGSFLNFNSGQCIPCPAGSYTASPNTRRSCHRCQQCLGGKFLILAPCTGTSNTKCRCVEGFMCTTMDCRSCAAHKVCKKGQEVQQKGDSFNDTICSDCRNGTYSDTGVGVCKPWTDCLARGLEVARNGSRTEDVRCGSPLTTPMVPTSSGQPANRTPKQPGNPTIEGKRKNEEIAGIIAIILLPCIFIPFSLYIAVLTKKKQKHLPPYLMNQEDLPVALITAGDDRCSCHCPEEEVGDWQLRQETTPKPPE